MKKRLLLSLVMGMMSFGLYAQAEVKVLSDVTSKIQNADFTADEPVTQTICTYDYNMADNGAGADGVELFGQQTITGWTASSPSDNIKVMHSDQDPDREDGANGRAAGIFALLETGETGPGLGGSQYIAPYKAEATEASVEGPLLGMVAVWGADFKYTQDVSLPAGGYMLVVTYCNVGVGTDITTNQTGFTAEDGTTYLSSKKSFPVNEWGRDTVFFRLDAATNGQLSIGLKGDGGSGGAAHLFFDNVKLYNIDTQYFDYVEVQKAKEELLALIEKAKGYGIDTHSAQAVYDNPSATMQDVKDAMEALNTAMDAATTDLSEYFINNPHFSEGEAVVGGICTYDYDCAKNDIALTNYSMLDVPGWTQSKKDNGAAAGVFAVGSDAFLGGKGYLPPTTLSDGVTTDANLLGVVTCWTMSAQYKQNVTLPAGKYTIGISYWNAGGANAVATNLMGFVTDDGTEYLGETTVFPVGKWANETIQFELAEETSGYFSLGYKSANTGSGNMPHLFVDGFSLVYVGTGIDPSMFALQAAVSTGEKYLDGSDVFYQALYDELESVLSAGRDLVQEKSKDSDANKAAMNAINEVLDKVKESISVYAKLQNFHDTEVADAMSQYEENEAFEDLYDKISELNDEIEAILESGEWDNDKIEETIAGFAPMIKETVQTVWDAAVASGEELAQDIDITVLFDQMAYTYSANTAQGANVPDKEWKYGSASNFKTQFGTAEVWNQSPFTVSRTLSNLPAGKYTITTKAFFRNADNETNYSMYDEANTPEASVFASNVKTGLCNVAAIASDEQKDGWVAAGEQFVPNSQEAAYNVFNDEAYTDLLQKSVSTVLVSEGDLTFGITADQMESNSWVIWYSFSIAYNAMDDATLDAELLALADEAQGIYDGGEIPVTKANDDLENAAALGYDAVEEGDQETKIAALQALKEALAYAEESKALVDELVAAQAFYGELSSKYQYYESSDETFAALLENLDQDEYEDNAQMQGFLDQLPVAWAAFVLGQDMTEASEEAPVDLTGLIINADFESGNAQYWTLTDGIGQNQGFQNNSTYTNEEEGIEVSQFIEAWRPGGAALSDGTISQTLKATLPAGYYRLSVDGYATNQTEIPEEGIQGAYLMAQIGASQLKTPMGIAVTSGTPQHFTVAFQADGASETTVGLLLSETNASWIAADNFVLEYIGTEAPDAIEGVTTDAEQRNAAIYNLAGQRVQKAVRGLYIIGGQKVLVK